MLLVTQVLQTGDPNLELDGAVQNSEAGQGYEKVGKGIGL